MKTLTLIIVTALILIGCNRECKDNDADNYGLIGKYGENCDYSHLDTWYKLLRIDSIAINDNPFVYNYKEVYFAGSGSYEDVTGGFGKTTKYYTQHGSNNCFFRFHPEKNLNDTLKSIYFYFGVPEAKNHKTTFDTEATINYTITDNKIIHASHRYFSKNIPVEFSETKTIKGTNYHFFSAYATNLNLDTIATAENLKSFNLEYKVNYDVFDVNVKISASECYLDGSSQNDCSK